MLKLLCVGLGGMGRRDRKNAEESGEFEVVAGVDVEQQIREDFEEETGKPTFSDLSEALDQIHSDAVLIAVPDKFHAPYSIQAMEAGRDVICEKPMAESLEDAHRMGNTAKKLKRMLMINNQFRWDTSNYHAHRLIKEGLVGQLRSLDLECYVFSDACMAGYRSTISQLILQDLGIHHFDLMRFLTGAEVESLDIRSWKSNEEYQPIPVNTAACGIMNMNGPVTAFYRADSRSLIDGTGYSCRASVTGSKGTLNVEKSRLTFQTHKNRHTVVPPEIIEPVPPERTAMQSYADAIKTRQPALTDCMDNIKSLKILFAALESAEKNSMVELS